MVRPLALALVVALSCLIAALRPYDVLFDRLTLGQPLLRAAAMLLCWLVGLHLLERNRLSLGITGWQRPAPALVAWIVGVALWCLLLDGLLFRAILPAGYATTESATLTQRLLYYGPRALNENVLYRLFLGSLFAWLLSRMTARPAGRVGLAMAGMALAHLLNVAVNVGMWGSSPAAIAWMILRFILPGLAWSWLFVRHGFVANESAAIGVHLILQPLVSLSF